MEGVAMRKLTLLAPTLALHSRLLYNKHNRSPVLRLFCPHEIPLPYK
jgi:hypothetical protein